MTLHCPGRLWMIWPLLPMSTFVLVGGLIKLTFG